jgi:hypothetical protein
LRTGLVEPRTGAAYFDQSILRGKPGDQGVEQCSYSGDNIVARLEGIGGERVFIESSIGVCRCGCHRAFREFRITQTLLLFLRLANRLTTVSKTDGNNELALSVRYLRCACDYNVELLGDEICFVQTDVDVHTARVGGVQPNAQEPRIPRRPFDVDDELDAMRRKGLIRFGVGYDAGVRYGHESLFYSVMALLSSL